MKKLTRRKYLAASAGFLAAGAAGTRAALALFLGELLRWTEETGTLRHTAAGWMLGALNPTAVPPLLRQVMREGRRLAPVEPMAQMSARAASRLAQLPAGVRAIEGAAPYPVRISPALDQLARAAMREHAG